VYVFRSLLPPRWEPSVVPAPAFRRGGEKKKEKKTAARIPVGAGRTLHRRASCTPAMAAKDSFKSGLNNIGSAFKRGVDKTEALAKSTKLKIDVRACLTQNLAQPGWTAGWWCPCTPWARRPLSLTAKLPFADCRAGAPDCKGEIRLWERGVRRDDRVRQAGHRAPVHCHTDKGTGARGGDRRKTGLREESRRLSSLPCASPGATGVRYLGCTASLPATGRAGAAPGMEASHVSRRARILLPRDIRRDFVDCSDGVAVAASATFLR
jgi:hypothetical protein